MTKIDVTGGALSLRKSLFTLTAAAALALGACAEGAQGGETEEAGAMSLASIEHAPGENRPAAAVGATAVTGTLNCNLEYEAFSPAFVTRPLVSFSQPMSVVATQGVAVSNGTYQLYAQVNPTPATNLSFNIGVYRMSTGKDIGYLVLPPQAPIAGYLFEQGIRITTVTVGGVAYDHLRVYCSMTP